MKSSRRSHGDDEMTLTLTGDADGLEVQGSAASVHPAFARESKAEYTPRWRPTPRKEADDFEREMLDQSAAELKSTVEELEKRFDAIENEGNEWKTRFETQQEMNQQLERQILIFQNKVEEARKNVREANKSPRDNRSFDDMEASPQMIKNLEKEKQSLYNQLRDLEWRLDQESKAYHKANDERKQHVLEINATKGHLEDVRIRQKMALLDGSTTARTARDSGGNIPDDQRVLDPKRGPIKKTAGVKNLPSLEMV
ncbi:coiled-coil domain-containing protein 169-like isoform X1 [Haliotis rubra]|uniref:coiled-coil domain-containing protein 169-like isoform X1 n=1 Tax=Haliotis rubra TaxID=36100 RepID=UPI001EE617B1|nr:coiled-coil domain-containing protein 169-like isoform X1 [Haliotis rubra]